MNYKWNLKDGFPASGVDNHGETVFSCFSSGGGSSMGYKLAGFNVLGGVEIDPKVAEAYRQNLKPKYLFVEKIQDFVNRETLPPELYDLTILDGSPPCSTFSMVGSREEAWGVKKKFREGQEEQILDTLFFDFIILAERLQPKIVVSENVPGILMGKAKKYSEEIVRAFDKAGFYTLVYILDSQNMAVCQTRKRAFFISIRKDLLPLVPCSGLFSGVPVLNLKFTSPVVPFKDIRSPVGSPADYPLTDSFFSIWEKRKGGDVSMTDTLAREGRIIDSSGLFETTIKPKRSHFSHQYIYNEKPTQTLTTKNPNILFDEPRYLNNKEMVLCSSFPQDYNFLNNPVSYLTGMSVPPLMVGNIALRLYEQWIKNF